jgi:ferredoxin
MPVISIDRIACDGRGICAELLPELIELDDWGYPIVRAGDVPAALHDLARRSVAACPVMAFRLFESPAPPQGPGRNRSPAP